MRTATPKPRLSHHKPGDTVVLKEADPLSGKGPHNRAFFYGANEGERVLLWRNEKEFADDKNWVCSAAKSHPVEP